MSIFSYIVTRDYGFAPNPFYNVCTLATCKPRIRKTAQIGDWILGFGSAKKGSLTANKIVFAMMVEEIISFEEYWEDSRFFRKRPVMNGSKKQKYGDNIYHHDSSGNWLQEDSHHKNPDGSINMLNLNRDTSTDKVLISNKFWYWGKKAINLPNNLQSLIHKGRNHSVKKNRNLENALEAWLNSIGQEGYIGLPERFEKGFERYDGN